MAGLIFFLIVGVIFQKRAAGRGSAPDYFRKRAARLMIPWVAWFVIYGLLNWVSGKNIFPHSSGVVANLATGPWIGLWYLPFSFVSAGVVYAGVRLFGRFSVKVQLLSWLAFSMVAIVVASKIRSSTSLVAPWAQYLQAAPSIPVGFAFASAVVQRPCSRRRLALLEGGLLLACGSVCLMDRALSISYGLGSVLVAVGFAFGRRLTWPIGAVSSLCLGVYLVHGAVMSGFKLTPIAQQPLLWFFLTVAGSFALVVLMRRVPILSKIV